MINYKMWNNICDKLLKGARGTMRMKKKDDCVLYFGLSCIYFCTLKITMVLTAPFTIHEYFYTFTLE